ncbi:MAG: stage II sporulation protein M [Candidatus Methanofastidiosa archaeon]|nr:stage II sporulation protein M [Candidatus Methanofastidiosa archaeon]HOM96649.1 stage II sporulation protein M [Methanofastidiosum sp.]HPC81539.1 stage II sporulation protein M [Methanofastidiosum sp.]HRS25746.1 stage II sporulation protein M [Methanofastidiosum sp.]
MESKKERIASYYKNEVFSTIKENKNLILFSIVLFLLSSISGFYIFKVFFSSNPEVFDSIIQGFADMLGPLKERTSFELFLTIFYVNSRTSFLIMILGIFIGLFPFLSLWLNGTILGLLYGKFMVEGESPIVFLIGILPHGIIEVPAIAIAASQGFRIGKEVIFPPQGKSRSESLRINLKKGIKLFAIILPLLLIAAFIEVYVSAQLFNVSRI